MREAPEAPDDGLHDLVLRGGRVIDPETGRDEVCDVGIRGATISGIGIGLRGRLQVDVPGKVIAPGLIDMHSHAWSLSGQRLQVMDGVTTALELECGAPDVASSYAAAQQDGCVVNYGFSASWAGSRMHVLAGGAADATSSQVLSGLGGAEWQGVASASQRALLLDSLERQLSAGALGVGMLLGYAPGTDPGEIRDVARLAAKRGAPTFTHARPLVEQDPSVPVDGATELVTLAAEVGGHMHYCHINSTSNQHLDRVAGLVSAVRRAGARVTAESYPYGSGMTVVGAESLRPETISAYELEPRDLLYVPTGQRVRSLAELAELRRTDPGGLIFERYFDEQRDHPRLASMVSDPEWAVVSDAMPVTWRGPAAEALWPVDENAVTHPRSAGTFGRMLRLAREGTLGLDLMQTLAKCSIHPAKILEAVSPAMRFMGRLQVGCFADLTIFDPDRVSDRATYIKTTQVSIGFTHVIVNGQFVVRDGLLVESARAGRAIRNESS